MDPIIAFGITLKKYRLQLKLSQEELALSANLDRTYISLLERSQRQPTLSTIFKLAEVLNIEPHKFIKEVEELIKSDL